MAHAACSACTVALLACMCSLQRMRRMIVSLLVQVDQVEAGQNISFFHSTLCTASIVTCVGDMSREGEGDGGLRSDSDVPNPPFSPSLAGPCAQSPITGT